MKEKNNFKRREKGQSLTELAVSFMLVMLILSGAVDLGRAYFALVALRDAAQEGVIYASVNPDDQDGVRSRVHTTSDSPINMSTTTVSFEYPTGFAADGSDACAGFTTLTGVDADGNGVTDIESNYVTVIVAYEFAFTMPLIPPIIGSNSITLRAEQTHTILSPSC